MKSTIIKFSELGDRIDAPFHILRKENEPRAEEISKNLSHDEAELEAVRILQALPANLRREIDPLVRTGNTRNPDIHDQTRAVKEYPYIALAVFEGLSSQAAEYYRAEAAKAESSASLFEEFSRKS